MKHLFLQILIFFLGLNLILGQTTDRIDSLENELNSNFGEHRIELLNTLAESYYRISIGKTIEYSYLSLQLAQQYNNTRGEAHALVVLAYANLLIDNYDIANDYIERSIKLLDKQNNYDLLIKAKSVKAWVEIRTGDTNEGKNMLDEARQLNMEHDAKQLFPLLFSGDFFVLQSKYKNALMYYGQALNENLYSSLPGYKTVLMVKIAKCYALQNNYQKAEEMIQQAIAVSDILHSEFERVNAYNMAAEILSKQKKYNAAIDTLNIAYKLSRNINYKTGTRQTLKLLAHAYAATNDYENAYKNHYKYTQLNDSIIEDNNSNRIDRLSVAYEADKQEQELLLIQREKEIKELENAQHISDNKRQKSLIYLFIAIIIILLLISLFIYNRLQYKRNSERRFQQLSNATFEGILIVEYRVIIEANNKIAELSGFSQKELYHRHITTLIDAKQYYGSDIEKEDKEECYETVLQTKKGKNIDVEILEKPFTYKGKPVRVIAVRDLTERKKAEDALRRSEQELRDLNAMKDKMFSIIGHDLKGNFWNFKIVFDSLWDEIFELEPAQLKEILNTMKESADATYSLLENLLSWARLQGGQTIFSPEKIKLQRIVNDNIKLLKSIAANKKIQIKNDVTDDIEVLADKNMLTTVIRNLVANALKFTNEGGLVRIIAIAGRDVVEVTVADTGVGISYEDQKKIFEPNSHHSTFGTKNEKGSGLGLLLCKEFVERNNGEIWVESTVGKGSKFKFTVPTAIEKKEVVTKKEYIKLQPI